MPQFELVSHVGSLRLSSGHSGLVLTLSLQLVSPCSAPACCWWTQASGLLLQWGLRLGTYSVFVCLFVCFNSWSCCPLWFQNSPQTQWWYVFLVFGNFSFTTPSPGWVSIPISFVSLFIFYILSYLLLKRMGHLSGCLIFSSSIQKLFCGIFSVFNWSFDEFVGEKVISPSYFSAILGLLPLSHVFLMHLFIKGHSRCFHDLVVW